MSESEGGTPRTWTIYADDADGVSRRVVVVEQSRYRQVAEEVGYWRERAKNEVGVYLEQHPCSSMVQVASALLLRPSAAKQALADLASSAGPGGRE